VKLKVKIFGAKGKDLKELLGTVINENVSKQLLEDPFAGAYDAADVVEPPYSIESFCSLYEISTMVHACVVAYEQNILGFGWVVGFQEGVDKDDKEAILQKEMFEVLLKRPNAEIVNGQTMFNSYTTDKETTGNVYIEVVRNLKGDICGLWNAASRNVRIRRRRYDRSLRRWMPAGFVQTIGTKKVYFKNFGDVRSMNKGTGEFVDSLHHTQAANELLFNRIYAPRSPYYGIPRFVSAGLEISGVYWAKQMDHAYFKNGCFVGKMMVITNGAIDDDSMAEIGNYMENMKGNPENAHKLLVVSLEAETDEEAATLAKQEKPNVKFENISDKDELGSYSYIEKAEPRIKRCFRLHDIFIGENKEITRVNFEIARSFTEEQVFKPIRRLDEDFFNQTIVAKYNLFDETAMDKIEIKFNGLPIGDKKAQAEIDEIDVKTGKKTIDELREEDKRFDKWWSQMPVELAKVLLEQGYPATGDLESVVGKALSDGNILLMYDKKDGVKRVTNAKQFVDQLLQMKKSINEQIKNSGK